MHSHRLDWGQDRSIEPQSPRADLYPQNSLLLAQIGDDLLDLHTAEGFEGVADAQFVVVRTMMSKLH